MKKNHFISRIIISFSLLIAEHHQLMTKPIYRKDIILMLNVLSYCIIHIYIVAVN